MSNNDHYADIINRPHHISKVRPRMPMSDRAAQFAPFAALTGYDSAIKETGRLTDEKIEFDEEALTALDVKIQILMDALDRTPEVTITYFKSDERKKGGTFHIHSYQCRTAVPAYRPSPRIRNRLPPGRCRPLPAYTAAGHPENTLFPNGSHRTRHFRRRGPERCFLPVGTEALR